VEDHAGGAGALESGQYFEELVGKKFDIAGGWWSVTVDPDSVLLPDAALLLGWNFCGFKSERRTALDAFRFTANAPRARRCTRSWCAGSRRKLADRLQQRAASGYWMKPNVQGSAPLSYSAALSRTPG